MKKILKLEIFHEIIWNTDSFREFEAWEFVPVLTDVEDLSRDVLDRELAAKQSSEKKAFEVIDWRGFVSSCLFADDEACFGHRCSFDWVKLGPNWGSDFMVRSGRFISTNRWCSIEVALISTCAWTQKHQ
jgi:hypothetical protein